MPLETCPRCAYSLRGLPSEHSCPECGLRYDPASKLSWAPSGTRDLLGHLLTELGYALGLMTLALGTPIGRWRFPATLGAVAVFVFVIFRYFRLRRIRERGAFAVDLPDGLLYQLVGEHACLLPWDEIAEIEPPGEGNLIVVHLRGGAKRTLQGMFVTRRNANALAKRCQIRLMTARQESSR